MTETAIATKGNNNPSIQLKDYNASMMKFQDEVLGIISQVEYRLTNQITNFNIQYMQSKQLYETTIESINAKYNQIAKSIALVNVKFEHLNDYKSFTQKAKEEITNHDIKINNLTKELSNACYKYDRIYLDNLLLPGFIGDSCKFKTTKEFFNDVIIQLSSFDKFKARQLIESQINKDKFDAIMKKMSTQVDVITKIALTYTEEAIRTNNTKMNNMVIEMKNRIEEMNMENSKYGIELKKKTSNITDEIKDMEKIKGEIVAKFESEIDQYKQDNKTTHLLLNEYQTDFNVIKKKFKHLAAFIKDVRFRSNLRMLIKRNDIQSLFHKMSADNLKPFEIDRNSLELIDDDSQLKYNTKMNEIKKKRKYLTQSAKHNHNRVNNNYGLENDTRYKYSSSSINNNNNKKINSFKLSVSNTATNLEFKKAYPINLRDDIHMNNISCYDYQTNPIKEVSINDQMIIPLKKMEKEKEKECCLKNNGKKNNNEHNEIKTKMNKLEAMFTELENYTRKKINEVSTLISRFLNANLSNQNNNNTSLFVSQNNVGNEGSSRNNHKITRKVISREMELKSSISCLPLSSNMIYHIQSNLRPSIEQLNKQNNLNTINRHKSMAKIKAKSGNSILEKQAATIPHDDISPKNNKLSTFNTPTINDAKIINKSTIIY